MSAPVTVIPFADAIAGCARALAPVYDDPAYQDALLADTGTPVTAQAA